MSTAFVAAALGTAGLVGCGGNSLADRAQPGRLYPFDSAVYLTVQEERTAQTVLERATAACMRDRGFDYTPLLDRRGEVEPDNPYGLLDAATANTDGYGIVPAVLRRRERPVATTGPQPDPAYVTALNGSEQARHTLVLPGGEEVAVASDGCVAKARVDVYGSDWDRLYYTFQSLSNTVIERAGTDPAVTAATADWSACVGRAGHPAAKPSDLRQAIESRAAQAADDAAIRAAARAELAVARVDATCQDRAGLRAAVAGAQASAERQLLTEVLRQDLHRLHQLKRAALNP
ncbi:hypothetical protein [Micromonospora polyrhachis]|uniref:Uncharacterized protein n=1 Tax=Micromonospora polyrhachis TaxID=1282883 RepID=A0A7W7SVC3_9ACTN|nr:hypothetical protein [Micromonospora polyrhachis]MBB4961611.1 hypothetical protein [Micromonospora polyrhachis]